MSNDRFKARHDAVVKASQFRDVGLQALLHSGTFGWQSPAAGKIIQIRKIVVHTRLRLLKWLVVWR